MEGDDLLTITVLVLALIWLLVSFILTIYF